MNYIPGFSNYLETSMPRYAKGGPARFAGEDVYEGEMIAPLVEQQYLPAVQPMTQEAVAPAAAPYVEPYQSLPAAQPMTQEAAAPYDLGALAGLDLSGLDSLYGMNFGTDFGGGAMGGQYEVDPNLQYVSAPLSNKGNATSQTGGNTFAVKADQPVRLVDHRTNQVVFEGSGFDAARKATELGQSLTDQFGRKANYSIQTADPAGNYSTVAYEKKNKSTLGQIANVVGTALPLAAMAIPGLQGLAAIGVGAGLGGAGAALKGDNILKGAAMGGLSAAGGQLLGGPLSKIGASNIGLRAGTAIGTGIGSTAGGLATGQSLKNALLGGAASGALSYMSPDITKGLKSLGIGPGANVNTSTSAPTGGDIVVSATPAVTPIKLNTSLGGSPNKIQQALNQKTEVPYDGLTVSGNRVGSTFGVSTGGDRFGTPGQDKSAFKKMYEEPYDPNEILVKATTTTTPVSSGLSPDVQAGIAEFEKNPIISEGSKRVTPVSVTDPGLAKRLADMENYAEKPLIEVTGNKTERPTPVAVSVVPPLDPLPPMDLKADPALTDKKKLGLEQYLRIAGVASGLVGGLSGGKGGTGQAGTYTRGGTGRLNPIFSAKLPSAGGLGAIGMNRTARPMGDVDWLTYGTRPELSFFDYSPRTASAPVTTPGAPTRRVIGQGSRFVGDRLVPYNIYDDGTSDAPVEPVTTPVPNNPAGPAMYVPDDMRFAEGGMFAAKGGGSPRRTEFAVNGPGTGRSDDIPAVLSDGEYVIDAETVALLGDGSSKAGAKKLDELRVKVRKHKGKKLAKGRFSANAKNPEAYLSGGRV